MFAVQILITLSTKEIDRLEVVKRVLERRLTLVKAAALLGLDERQVRRMCAACEAEGASGLASRRRGRPSNNRTHEGLPEEAMTLIRVDRHADALRQRRPPLVRDELGRKSAGTRVQPSSHRGKMARVRVRASWGAKADTGRIGMTFYGS